MKSIRYQSSIGLSGTLFAIESCSVDDGKLGFNANRRINAFNTANDCVAHFNDFVDR